MRRSRFWRETASLVRGGSGTESPRTGPATKRWRAPSPWRIPRRRRPGRRRSSATRTAWRARPEAPPGSHVRTASRSPVTSCAAPGRSTRPCESKRTLSWPSASVSWGSARGSNPRCASSTWGRTVYATSSRSRPCEGAGRPEATFSPARRVRFASSWNRGRDCSHSWWPRGRSGTGSCDSASCRGT